MKHEKISSRDNERLKSVRKVRDGKQKDYVFVEGIRLCEEALRSAVEITECFFREDFTSAQRAGNLIDRLAARGAKVFELSSSAFDSIADTSSPQGIALLCRRPVSSPKRIAEVLETGESTPVVLLLDEINNPSNLGAIVRTCEAAGVSGLITSRRSADAFSPKAVRASMGSVFRLPLWIDASVTEVFDWARSKALAISAADSRAEHSYTDVDWTRSRLLVFGSEAHGVGSEWLARVDTGIRIPMKNNVESLNIAVSCGILLFEAKRQNERAA